MINVSELVLGPDEKINFDVLRNNIKIPHFNHDESNWFIEQGVKEMLSEAQVIKTE